ncbi:hypothetical protein PVAG01_02080 [Phlyctema vagabunda]|uniref:BTB domain-containing protein n=1 Tax=Phlyctema vagabunda TaxID=108571 RepID=A0ABR4PPR8_9HELO
MASESTSGSPSQVVELKSPGIKPDTRLQVFTKTFHVHSIILKQHSRFFRTFMDSIDKSTAPAGLWKYDYVAVCDDDGYWGLESAAIASLEFSSVASSTGMQEELLAFEKLLCAFYNRPYEILDLAELELLARQADFYGASPVFSASLTSALFRSPGLTMYIEKDALDLMYLAYQLRQPILFRECLGYVVGRDTPGYEGINSYHDPTPKIYKIPKIQCILAKAKAQIANLTNSISLELYRSLCGTSIADQETKKLVADCIHVLTPFHNTGVDWNPTFYHTFYILFRAKNFGRPRSQLHSNLAMLCSSNLVLDKGPSLQPIGRIPEFFHCATIKDEDLPWDQDEEDWVMAERTLES